MNIKKFTSVQIGHVCAHFERSVEHGKYSNEIINEHADKTALNYNLAPDRDGQVNYIHEMLEKVKHQNRKDLIVMASCIVHVPPGLNERHYDDFFKESYNFLVDRFGKQSGLENPEDIVISCYTHWDETTPHFHFAFCPIFDDGRGPRFLAKKAISRDNLQTLHQDLQKHLREKGIYCNILTGSTIRDERGKSVPMWRYKKIQAERTRERNIERSRRF